MDKNLLIEIFVGPSTNEGRIGTGYPIGNGLILTAGHLFKPSDGNTENIFVRWHHQKDNDAREWRQASICWPGTDKLDAAVLSCPFPDTMNNRFKSLSRFPHHKTLEWDGQGFPAVGKRDDNTREPISFSGHAYSAAETSNIFELGVQYPVGKPDGWCGASGSPVFVGDKIIGVVVTCPKSFNQSRFWATPTWKLFENKDFCKIYGDPSDGSQHQKALERVGKFLETWPALHDLIKDRHDTNPSSALETAQRVLHPGLEGFLNEFFILSNELDDCIKDENAKQRAYADLCDVVFSTAPLLIESAITEPLDHQKQGIFVRTPTAIGSCTVGEIAMARLDGRKTRYSTTDTKLQRGEYEVPTPPDNGFAGWSKNYEAEFEMHLINQIVSRYGNANNTEKAKQNLAKFFKSSSAKKITSFHCVESDIYNSSKSIESALININNKYPDLVLIMLHDDREVDVIESISHFVKIHHQVSKI